MTTPPDLFFRTLSCRVLSLVFTLLLLLVLRPEHQCLGLIPVSQDGVNNIECRPVEIQLYTWSGPGFNLGECWYQGHHFANGATWGQMDIPGAPYCICDEGKIRIFYSQQQAKPAVADSLTLLRPVHGSSPTSNDLAKWPIPNVPIVRQRTVICSTNRFNRRVRSRDGCIGCKCSRNGHWLCRRPPSLPLKRNQTITTRQRTSQQQTSRNNRYPYLNSSNSLNIQLRVTTLLGRPQCPLGSAPQFCILIERLSSSNISEKSSRYIEIPRETSWIDQDTCTRCSCALNGHLTCEFLHPACNRPCLIYKTRPVSIMYYFPSGSKWLTPPNDKCRSCMCVNGQRRCINCDQIIKIGINTNNNQQRSEIGEYSLLPSSSSASVKITPCLLKINVSSHRLILPGQQTWFEERCYFCSKRGGRLISC